MKKNYLYILIIIILIAGGYLIYNEGYFLFLNRENRGTNDQEINIPIGVNKGQRAPDFTLDKTNGESLSLSDLRGKKVFLNFWATWCSPCKKEMPDIQKLYEEHKNIKIIAVNSNEPRGTVAEFLMLNGYSFPVALDKSGEVSNKYLIRAIPTTFILDENGIIINKHSGILNYNQMLDLLKIK